MKSASHILLSILLMSLAMAEPAQAQNESGRYQRCLSDVDIDARGALESADAWAAEDGGVAAGHCAGLALSALKRYTEAARRFSMLAKDSRSGDAALRAELYAQAGNAWLLGGRPDAAYEALSQSLALQPDDLDVLFDRARASVLGHALTRAKSDLDRVIAARPYDTDARVLRATVRREGGDLSGAFEDADIAATLDGGFPEAFIERGLVRHAQGDSAGAIADWQHVLEMTAGSEAKDAARRFIEDDALKMRDAPAKP